MKDILDRIEDSSPNESSHELVCRLRDCAHEIEALRAALAARPDAQADERGAMTKAWGEISASMYARMSPWEFYQAGWHASRAAAPQEAQGVPEAAAQAVCRTCNGNGMIGGPSYYAPDEGGEPCPDCCDTPSYCSSVRRCTAKDAEQPSERGEQDCPHGVDDGACGWCYDEATSGEKGAAFEGIRDALHETYGFASTSPRGQENINFALGKLDEIEEAHAVLIRQGAPSAPTLGQAVEQTADRERWKRALSFAKGIISRLDTTEVMRSSVSGIAYDAAERAVFIRNLATEALAAPVVVQPQAAEPKGLNEYREALRNTLLALQCADCSELSPELEGKVRLARALLAKGE